MSPLCGYNGTCDTRFPTTKPNKRCHHFDKSSYQMRLKMKSNGETWRCEWGGCGIRDEGYRCVWRRRYKETGSRGSTHPALQGGADQEAGRVAAGETAAHRAQPAGYQLVFRDVTTTTGARRRRMGPGAQQQQQAVREGPDRPQRHSK